MSRQFYGYEDQERLDLCHEDTVRHLMEAGYSDFPIKVYVYKQMNIAEDLEKFSKYILEDVLERLDDDYGDPDSNGTEPTENMKKASLEFSKVIVDEYHVWSCEKTNEVIEYSKEEAYKIVGG